MRIFHFKRGTGEFLGEGVADPDPLDEDNVLIPAGATVTEPPSFNAQTHRPRWNGTAWVVEAIPAPPAPPVPTRQEILDRLLEELRSKRGIVMDVLDGLQVDALTDADAATATAIRAAKQACRDMPALNVSSAQSEADLRAAYLAEWRRIAALVPPAVRSAFAAALA